MCEFQIIIEPRNTMVTPVLYYFDTAGRAEAIRLAFRYAKLPFEDKRFNHEEFKNTYKQQSPSGQVPFLQIGDKKLTETLAILSYVGTLANLMPKDPLDHAKFLQIYMIVESMFPHVRKLYHKEAKPEDVRGDIIPTLEFVDKLVAESQDKDGYVVGGTLTVLDLFIHGTLKSFDTLGIERGNTLTHLGKVSEAVCKHPNLQEYFNQTKST